MAHPDGADHDIRKRRVKDYDPAEFFVPAANQHDHSDNYRFRAPKLYNRRIAEIVVQGHFPFKTPTDVLRYCLHIGLQRLDRLQPSSTVQQQLEMVRMMLADAQFQQDFNDTFLEMEKVINRYIEQEDRGAARNLVARSLSQIRRMPDETNWRSRYEKELLRRYGWLLKDGKGARLTVSEGTDNE